MKLTAIFFFTAIALAVLMQASATTYSLEPAADARVIHFPGYDTQNFASDILSVYTSTSGGNTQRMFVQFNLGTITLATNEHVESATLTLTALTGFGTNSSQPMEVGFAHKSPSMSVPAA